MQAKWVHVGEVIIHGLLTSVNVTLFPIYCSKMQMTKEQSESNTVLAEINFNCSFFGYREHSIAEECNFIFLCCA